MNGQTLRGAKLPPKAVRSKMDTLILTISVIDTWQAPPFQRPLKVNERVRTIGEELKHNGGVIDGVLTLGTVGGEDDVYLLDGQHRIAAMRFSELKECIADVRICSFESMADMGDEFVKLNSAIVRMNPDDVMRAMEGTIAAIHNIREACPFVGYANIRRGTANAMVSMSSAIRTWVGSGVGEVPKQANGSAINTARELTAAEAQHLSRFLNLAHAAWGSDPQNFRLWTSVNLCICMWMYRKLVMDTERGVKRYVVLNPDLFKKCLMSVAASSDYVDWLVGRALSERDRGPCYLRLKGLFIQRLRIELHTPKVMLPQPAWAGTTGGAGALKTWKSRSEATLWENE